MPGSAFGASAVPAVPLAELSSESAILGHLGVAERELKKIWWFREGMYTRFDIAKGKGKTRVILAPEKRLKYLQRRIAPLLGQLYRVRNPVHGFVAGKSVKTNAQSHLRRRFLLNLDLADFFPSISENRVAGVLRSLGADRRAAEIVARICCHNDCLPQGAPTSPMLSNLICFRMDRQLMAVARDSRCIYTRYADDITFSSHQPMNALFEGPAPPAGPISPDLMVPAFRQIFTANGFTINPSKAHYADRHSRKMVTGLKVNELLNVDRRYVRNLRAALHSVEVLGLEDAQTKFEEKHGGESGLVAHLAGKVSWLRFIRGQTDPVFRSIASRFNKSFPDNAITVAPSPAEVRDRAVWIVEDPTAITQGTAFFLQGVGLVTAAHCVESGGAVDIYHPSKRANMFTATVFKVDVERDLAILSHDIPPTEFFELDVSPRPVATGHATVAVGYPGFGPGDSLNIREGKVQSLAIRPEKRLIEVSQKLTPGMSGGPLLDSADGVIGIIHKGGPGEGRDFAVSIDALLAWLAE